MLLLGTIVAAIVSFIAVKWLLRYVQTHTFVAFGWYRIALAILIGLLLLLGVIVDRQADQNLKAALKSISPAILSPANTLVL